MGKMNFQLTNAFLLVMTCFFAKSLASAPLVLTATNFTYNADEAIATQYSTFIDDVSKEISGSLILFTYSGTNCKPSFDVSSKVVLVPYPTSDRIGCNHRAIAEYVKEMGGIAMLSYFPQNHSRSYYISGFPSIDFPIYSIKYDTAQAALAIMNNGGTVQANFVAIDETTRASWQKLKTIQDVVWNGITVLSILSYLIFCIWSSYILYLLYRFHYVRTPIFAGICLLVISCLFRFLSFCFVPYIGSPLFSDLLIDGILPYELGLGLIVSNILFILIIWLQIMSTRKTLPKHASRIFRSPRWFLGYCGFALFIILLSVFMPLYGDFSAWYVVIGLVLLSHAFGFLIIGSILLYRIHRSGSKADKGDIIRPVLIRISTQIVSISSLMIILCAILVYETTVRDDENLVYFQFVFQVLETISIAVLIHFYASSRLVSSITDTHSGPTDKSSLKDHPSKLRSSMGISEHSKRQGPEDAEPRQSEDLQGSLSASRPEYESQREISTSTKATETETATLEVKTTTAVESNQNVDNSNEDSTSKMNTETV